MGIWELYKPIKAAPESIKQWCDAAIPLHFLLTQKYHNSV